MNKQELVAILKLFSTCVLTTAIDESLDLKQKEALINFGIDEVADTVMICTKRCAAPSNN